MDGLLIGPATRRQALFASICALAILLTLALAAPRAREALPAIAPFMPMCALTVFTTSGIAAFLLGARFAATRVAMLAALGGAYAFTAIAVALQLLMFPGVFARTGLLGALPHSAAWMWVFWHGGFPVLVIVAELVRKRLPAAPFARERLDARGWLLIAGPAAVAALLGVLVTHVDLAPPFSDVATSPSPAAALTNNLAGIVILALNVIAIALVLLKGRLRLVLDLWIVVALLASLVDTALNTLSIERFTLGWYVARVFSMFAPGVLVCVLVWEVTALYRQLAEEHASLIRASARDALTRVYNRSYFDEQFRQAFDRATRSGLPLTLIMIDVDHFKHYNDAFGHLHGDACLGAVAGALAGTLRQPGGFVARYGGEEFALVLPDTDAHEASSLAENARAAVEQLGIPSPAAGGLVTVSAGCATSDAIAAASPTALIEAADAALYAAKRAGRNRVSHAGASIA
jgi:diguanylate cyclase (GGDEF)-like protein